MLGKIISIKEVEDIKFSMKRYSEGMDGYKVVTDKHTFYVLINNVQSCCEEWGYLTSDDDMSNFINVNLIEVNLTDKALNKTILEATGDDVEIQFVDFVTDIGVFQIAVYNAHNGYYGHDIKVVKDDEILLNSVL